MYAGRRDSTVVSTEVYGGEGMVSDGMMGHAEGGGVSCDEVWRNRFSRQNGFEFEFDLNFFGAGRRRKILDLYFR